LHTESIEPWLKDHTFGQDVRRSGERRTLIVIAITAVTMAVEIAAGIAFGSMALLADGLHMGSHAAALGIAAFAYYYTRRHASDPRFNFGTGKVNSLAAFASAVMLGLFALIMAWESVHRFLFPVAIGFNQAIAVAVIGLSVNGACLAILGGHDSAPEHGHGHGHEHEHGHDHDHGVKHEHGVEHENEEGSGHPGPRARGVQGHSDHNLLAAYMHVLADLLTSVLAIVALTVGKYWGMVWLDPAMGIAGAVLIVVWSWGLIRSAARVLLDVQGPSEVRETIRRAIESEGDNRISDLHVWSVGPGIYAAEIAVVSGNPLESDRYFALLPRCLGLVHVTVETRRCPDCAIPAIKCD